MEKEQISFFDFQGRYGKEEYSSLREKGSYYPERLEQGCMGFRKSLFPPMDCISLTVLPCTF